MAFALPRKVLFSFSVVLAWPALAHAEILKRADWNAKPAISARKPPIQNVTAGAKRVTAENVMPSRGQGVYLTIHHSAIRARAFPVGLKLSQWQAQQQKGYPINYPGYTRMVYLGDIPYHFFVDGSGQVAEGRELAYAAYSNTVYKTPIEQHITVVLEGNFEETHPPQTQVKALVDLLEDLAKRHNISLANIGGHRDVAQTLCPGRHMIARLPEIRAELARRGLK